MLKFILNFMFFWVGEKGMGDERDERVREGGKWDRESGTCEEGILEICLVIIILLH